MHFSSQSHFLNSWPVHSTSQMFSSLFEHFHIIIIILVVNVSFRIEEENIVIGNLLLSSTVWCISFFLVCATSVKLDSKLKRVLPNSRWLETFVLSATPCINEIKQRLWKKGTPSGLAVSSRLWWNVKLVSVWAHICDTSITKHLSILMLDSHLHGTLWPRI